MDDNPIEFFYADPPGCTVKWYGDIQTPWGPVKPIRIPHGELAVDDMPSIRARLDDEGGP